MFDVGERARRHAEARLGQRARRTGERAGGGRAADGAGRGDLGARRQRVGDRRGAGRGDAVLDRAGRARDRGRRRVDGDHEVGRALARAVAVASTCTRRSASRSAPVALLTVTVQDPGPTDRRGERARRARDREACRGRRQGDRARRRRRGRAACRSPSGCRCSSSRPPPATACTTRRSTGARAMKSPLSLENVIDRFSRRNFGGVIARRTPWANSGFRGYAGTVPFELFQRIQRGQPKRGISDGSLPAMKYANAEICYSA